MSELTPQEDAERIRLKRLARLGNINTSPAGASGSPSPSTPVNPPPKPQPKAAPSPGLVYSHPARKPYEPAPASPVPAKKKTQSAPPKLDLPTWEDNAIGTVFQVTLKKEVAERSGFEIVWLKGLAEELQSEGSALVLNGDITDRLLIARLELDPQSMSDDLDYVSVLASLPAQQTVFEYLVGCWKRLNTARSAVLKKGYTPVEAQQALGALEKLRELVVSYTGLTLQEPEMFPQPQGKPLGPTELVAPLLSLSSLSAPLASSSSVNTTISPSEIDTFLQDLARRFEPDNELDEILGPVVAQLLYHPSLWRPEGLGGGDASWRGVVGGLEALVSVKAIAIMITRLPSWIPEGVTAASFERVTLLGPLCRLGVFGREWPSIAQAYFSEPEKRSRTDVDSSNASLRGTLKSLQSSLFQVFNTLVRASAESRDAVLRYFSTAISLNVKRGAMQVEPETVATDSFMVNLQSILLRFAEPFMDAKYTKIDRIDTTYLAHAPKVDVKEETRIKATSDEAAQWVEENASSNAGPPNFISDIFYLTVAISHFGYLRTISNFEDLGKHVDELQRHLDMLQGDGSWMGGPFQARTEAAITQAKTQMTKIQAEQQAYRVQIMDPELVFRTIGFINFVSSWLIRIVDPRHAHPTTMVELPLPQEVPMTFRVLPEYFLEDVVDYFLFIVRYTPESLELSGKTELVIFALTFLTSTWYIKNPFLKAHINEALFYGILGYGNERNGILGNLLNTHPMALKHLMPALMQFYIEVEQTGASSQFYDKFNARRNIAYILKAIWDNPTHREALNTEARNVDKFVKFINLMINDVTYLMDESLSELTQIYNIQTEMQDTESWNAQSVQHRRERESTLRQLERHASGYITLGRSTVELLKVFTAETKAPFMMPEIVDRLAAMLDYNLEALVGPKCNELKVKDPEKYRFKPKELLSDILQVFLNLSDQEEFVLAVAGDGRSYKQELFQRAAGIATKRALKSGPEVQQLLAFVVKVEEARLTLEAEDDLGEIPDEFLDPLMATVMRDPVLLPSSKTIIDRSTIKSHLLSDSKDPFNRAPLSIEDVVPDPELKARIQEFLVERRKNKMDITE
ncbi:hypothetical protein HWV62_255 [Athelia sp. TMB]|nr:hypothetical protein HWV62_255 [Athelia sp. TMB]